jgi:hypothetical protein
MLTLGSSMRHFIALTVATGLLAVGVPPATAGTYTVLSCRDRTGARAVLNDGSGGWMPGSTGGPGLDSLDYCDSPSGEFFATVSGVWAHPVGSMAWWRFVAPAGTSIEEADVLYSGLARPYDGNNQGAIYFTGAQAANVGHHWGEGPIATRWISRPGLHDAWFQATAQCDGTSGQPDCPGGSKHATIEMYRSEMLLADATPPTAGAASGSAVASASWQGTQTFTFAASDQGGGLYQAILDVDGAPVLAQTIDDWGGRCVDTTPGERVFRYPRPCLTSVDAVVPVDAGALPAGDHDIALRVSDAAGNVRTVYAARKTIVAPARTIGPGSALAERGPANGDNAADAVRLRARWARTARSTLIGPFGRREVIRGRLSDAAGVGVRNARIELITSIDHRVGQAIDKGGARTRGDGRFTIILPRDVSSRTLVLRYRSHANDTVTAAEHVLALKVRAGAKLTVTPRVTTRGQTVRLRGRLTGRPLPVGGKVVEMQARSPGQAWITFRTVRTSRRGRFATSYTFRRSGPALYEMRARARATDDYPFATGSSRVVRVRVR